MTAHQFRAALSRLGLTQVGTARLLGVNDTTVRRWCRHGASGTVEILISLMLTGKISVTDISHRLDIAGIEPD